MSSVDPTVFEQHPNGPATQALPAPAPEVGDLVNSGDHPLFEDPGTALQVVVNVSTARQEGGVCSLRVVDRGQVLLTLTAAEAHQLAVDLHQSADVVGGIRQAAGFQT